MVRFFFNFMIFEQAMFIIWSVWKVLWLKIKSLAVFSIFSFIWKPNFHDFDVDLMLKLLLVIIYHLTAFSVFSFMNYFQGYLWILLICKQFKSYYKTFGLWFLVYKSQLQTARVSLVSNAFEATCVSTIIKTLSKVKSHNFPLP